jgi:spore coat protein U-like protein
MSLSFHWQNKFIGSILIISVCSYIGSAAAATGDLSQIQCVLASANLDFGRINTQRAAFITGEGEMVVVCQNQSVTARREELTLAFPTMGSQSALLHSGTSALPVMFYHDAQFAEYWGDDHNGASAMRVQLDLGPHEQQRLHFPVHALLQNRQGSAAGIYHSFIPVTLTTKPVFAW